MNQENHEPHWQINLIKPRLPWSRKAVRPAEVGFALTNVMMNRENLLEDAKYNKIVPNHYIVELSAENYLRNFKPISDRLLSQWRDKLIESMMTANSRLGRKEYRFGGQLKIELRSGQDLAEGQARILSQVRRDFDVPIEASIFELIDNQEPESPYLELLNGERRWRIKPGENLIGRDESCDIHLDLPLIREKRLVSSQHAHIRCEGGQCILMDGSLTGKPSVNGSYVNYKRISLQGVPLKDGDMIILAALDPANPTPDTPGVAAFRFRSQQETRNK